MAKIATISSATAREFQPVGDIVVVQDDAFIFSNTEESSFDILSATNVTRADIGAVLVDDEEEGKVYPKFRFTVQNLTAQQIADLADVDVDKADTLVIIGLIQKKEGEDA